MRFTPRRIAAARNILGQYPFGSLDIAIARMRELFGGQVTTEELGRAFERAGLSSPENYMVDADRRHCQTCRCKVVLP